MVEEESLTMSERPRDFDDAKPLVVRRGRVESVDLYEIKDSELDLLEKGTPAELQLNFSIFLLSLAFSAIASLLTATFPSRTIETTFIVISVIGILGGVYLMIIWSRTRSAVKQLCKKIRERIPPEALTGNAEAQETAEVLPDEAEDIPSPKG